MLQQYGVFTVNGPMVRKPTLDITKRLNRQLQDRNAAKEGAGNGGQQQESDTEKFNELISKSTKVLCRLKSVFPFDMFPKTITIDPEKVTVKFNEFFSSGEIRSIHIPNVAQVYVDIGPIFATLNIVDQVYIDESSKITIPYLKKEDAMRARRIIQGLVIAHTQQVDVRNIDDKDLVKKLEQIGRMQ